MKTLIVYYSFTHNNAMLAKQLQETLQCDIHEIETVKRRSSISILLDIIFNRTTKLKPHPYLVSSYDQCIFVGPVWAGKIATPLKAFLSEEKYHINRYSFITVCGGGNSQQRDKITKDLARLLEKDPLFVEELWINDLLSDEKKNTIKYTSGYRLHPDDLNRFKAKITKFIQGTSAKSTSKSRETEKVG